MPETSQTASSGPSQSLLGPLCPARSTRRRSHSPLEVLLLVGPSLPTNSMAGASETASEAGGFAEGAVAGTGATHVLYVTLVGKGLGLRGRPRGAQRSAAMLPK